MAVLRLVPLLIVVLGIINQTAAQAKVELKVKGILPPVFTPVDKDGKLNLKIIPKYAKFVKENGLDGVLVTGSAGECDKFSVDEKKKLVDAWLKAARPLNLTVMVQVGGSSLPDTKEYAKYAEEVGVDAILTLPELYYKPDTVEKLVYYLKCVASAAPRTPILYYHIPTLTHVEVNMLEFLELATQEVATFRGIKVEDFEAALQLRTKVKVGQRLFVANSSYIAPAALMGFENFIMGELNVFPELMKNIIRNSQTCELKKTRACYEKLEEYKHAINCQGRSGIPAMKETMSMVTGINVGPVRSPEMPLTEKQKVELEASLKVKGIVLKVDLKIN